MCRALFVENTFHSLQTGKAQERLGTVNIDEHMLADGSLRISLRSVFKTTLRSGGIIDPILKKRILKLWEFE